jgi:hypothetical protein
MRGSRFVAVTSPTLLCTMNLVVVVHRSHLRGPTSFLSIVNEVLLLHLILKVTVWASEEER